MSQVVIVGGGPVGLMSALILGQSGITVTLIESRNEVTSKDESRAIVWMPRALELLERLAIIDPFLAIGVRRTKHIFLSPQDDRLLTLELNKVPSRYNFTLQMPQHDSERLLESHAVKTGKVKILRGCRATAISQTHSGVTVTYNDESGKQQQIRADWGIGADGTHGVCREALGIATHWNDYGTDSAVADFELKTDRDPTVSHIVLNATRPHGLFAFAPGRWRLIYRLNKGEDRKSLTTESAASELLKQYYPDVTATNFFWASAFRLGQGNSENYRANRWFLAGDAAHPMGPSAGAGMMLGLLGAWRLCSRLVAVITHQIDEAELDEYEYEQHAAARQIQKANKMIFKNLAITNSTLGAIRNFGLKNIGKIPAIRTNITETEAMLRQSLGGYQ